MPDYSTVSSRLRSESLESLRISVPPANKKGPLCDPKGEKMKTKLLRTCMDDFFHGGADHPYAEVIPRKVTLESGRSAPNKIKPLVSIKLKKYWTIEPVAVLNLANALLQHS